MAVGVACKVLSGVPGLVGFPLALFCVCVPLFTLGKQAAPCWLLDVLECSIIMMVKVLLGLHLPQLNSIVILM